MQEVGIRKITKDDYIFINKWWIDSGLKLPPEGCLPDNGLGGLIIEKEKPIAALYIYTTNSTMGYIDFLISDPTYKEKDRYEVILSLFKACIKKCNEEGIINAWFMSDNKAVIDRALAIGFSINSVKQSIITYNFNKIK